MNMAAISSANSFPVPFRCTESYPGHLRLGLDKAPVCSPVSCSVKARKAGTLRLRSPPSGTADQAPSPARRAPAEWTQQIVPQSQLLSLLEHIEKEIWPVDPIIRDGPAAVYELVRPHYGLVVRKVDGCSPE